jgi:hypothetical protein
VIYALFESIYMYIYVYMYVYTYTYTYQVDMKVSSGLLEHMASLAVIAMPTLMVSGSIY